MRVFKSSLSILGVLAALSLTTACGSSGNGTSLGISPGGAGVGLRDLFDQRFYLWKYPEVASAIDNGQFTDGLDHYLKVGRPEGLQPSGYYNEQYYLGNNPDVVAGVESGQYTDGLDHFLRVGQFEERSPSDLIDPDWIIRYLKTKDPETADVIESDGLTATKFFVDLPLDQEYIYTAERAFTSIWNDRDFETIDQLTTGPDFIDRNEFTILPGLWDGGRPGTFIGPPEKGGEPGTEGLKQTAQLFIDCMPDIFLEQKEFIVDLSQNKLMIRWEENGTQVIPFGSVTYFVAPGVSLADALNVPALSGPTARNFQGVIIAHFNPEGKMFERSGYPLGHLTTANFLQMGVPLGSQITDLIKPVFLQEDPASEIYSYADFGKLALSSD